MTSSQLQATYPCVGSSALAPSAPSLVLIEGGAPVRAARPARRSARRPGGLDARQTLVALVAGGLLVLAVCIASAATDALAQMRVASALDGAAVETVVVRPGDSLWGIAEGREPEGVGTADVVSWIEETNSLTGACLEAGQRLVVPVPAS